MKPPVAHDPLEVTVVIPTVKTWRLRVAIEELAGKRTRFVYDDAQRLGDRRILQQVPITLFIRPIKGL